MAISAEVRKPTRPLQEFVIDRSPETSLRGIPLSLLCKGNGNGEGSRINVDSGSDGFSAKEGSQLPQQAEGATEGTGSARGGEPVCGVSTSILRKALHDVLGPNIMIYEKPYFE